jgi:hypothetical protein
MRGAKQSQSFARDAFAPEPWQRGFQKLPAQFRAVVHPAMSFPDFVSLPSHVHGAIKFTAQ